MLIKATSLIVYILCLFGAPGSVPASSQNNPRIIPLPDLLRPRALYIDQERFYIFEHSSVSIYNRKTVSLISKFGKRGEGPGEFKTNPDFHIRGEVLRDRLLIFSPNKISYYKKDGTLIEERTHSLPGTVYRLGKKFVTINQVPDNEKYVAYYLIDSNYKKIKELSRFLFPIVFGKEWHCFIPYSYPRHYKDYIFFSGGADFEIKGFDDSGKNVYTIRKNYTRMKVTKERIANFHRYFRTDHPNNVMYDRFKNWFKFPKHLPALKNFLVSGGRVYAQTYKQNENKEYEVFIFKLDGKMIQIPLPSCFR